MLSKLKAVHIFSGSNLKKYHNDICNNYNSNIHNRVIHNCNGDNYSNNKTERSYGHSCE